MLALSEWTHFCWFWSIEAQHYFAYSSPTRIENDNNQHCTPLNEITSWQKIDLFSKSVDPNKQCHMLFIYHCILQYYTTSHNKVWWCSKTCHLNWSKCHSCLWWVFAKGQIRSGSGYLFADADPAGLKHCDLGGLDLIIQPGICCSGGWCGFDQ